MSSKKILITVGASARQSDVQRLAVVAAAADDRAAELSFTPWAAQKKVAPLAEETASVNPRLLVVGHDTDGAVVNGTVNVRPCYLAAGVAADPYSIGIAASLKASTGSPVFGNNSSGSPRYDLLYATVNYGTVTDNNVRQKPLNGGSPVASNIPVAVDPLVTLSIVAGVSSSTPLSSLPADAGDGSSYNLGLAMVAIPNGYAGTAINQSTITPLWSAGSIPDHRVQRTHLVSLFGSGANNAPATALSPRWAGVQNTYGVWKHISANVNVEKLLDNSIDWRKRDVRVVIRRIQHSGSISPEPEADTDFSPAIDYADGAWIPTGNGSASAVQLFGTVGSWGGNIFWRVDNTTGALYLKFSSNPVDVTNGDNWTTWIDFTGRYDSP